MVRSVQILLILILLSCANKVLAKDTDKIESPILNYRNDCQSFFRKLSPLLHKENKILYDDKNITVESILNQVRERFRTNFKNETSLDPTDALKKYIRENPATAEVSAAGEVLDRILNNEYSFAIHFPRKYMDDILENGFLNQHETGHSEGLESIAIRNSAESSMSTVPTDVYKKISPHIRPKYGMLWPDINGHVIHNAKPEYGDYVFILKKKNLVERTTWTPLDSINLIKDDHFNSLEKENFITELSWYQKFIPLENISLATIFLHEFNKVQLSSKKFGSYIPKKTKVGNSSPPRIPARIGSYLELQFWGQVTTKDVDALVFLGEPPSTETFLKLKEIGIKVYDGRDGLRTLWTPSF